MENHTKCISEYRAHYTQWILEILKRPSSLYLSVHLSIGCHVSFSRWYSTTQHCISSELCRYMYAHHVMGGRSTVFPRNWAGICTRTMSWEGAALYFLGTVQVYVRAPCHGRAQHCICSELCRYMYAHHVMGGRSTVFPRNCVGICTCTMSWEGAV